MNARPEREWPARAALALLVIALFRSSLQGGVFYERDIHLIWHPQVEGFVRAVAGGALPLWDPSPAFGQPLLADPGAQVLYPPTWLNLVLRPWTYYTLFAFGHVLVSALAWLALARRWGLSRLASVTGASAWALCGPFLSLLSLAHHFASASLLPLVFLAAERAIERRRARDVAALGAVLGLQVLAGSPDFCSITLVALGLWVAAVHVDWRRPRTALAPAAGGAAALLLAAALSAGLWVGALDLVLHSSRRGLPAAVRTYWSVHPLALLDALFDGVPRRLPLAAGLSEALFEGREPFLASLYLGLPALALAGAGLAGSGSRRRRWALGGLVLGAALVALGRYAPFYEIVTTLLVPLRVLRYPVKAMVLAGFAWAGLVAFGVDTWQSVATGRRRLALAAAPAAIATALAGGGALLLSLPSSALPSWAAPVFAPQSTRPLLMSHVLAAHAILGVALIALVLLRSARRAAWTAAVAAAVVVLDLAVTHPEPSPVAPRALYTHRPEILAGIADVARARVYSYDYGERTPFQRRFVREDVRSLERVPAGWTPEAASALAMQLGLVPQTPGRWGVRQAFDVDFRGLQAEPLAYLTRLVRVTQDRPLDTLRLLRLASVTHVVAAHRVAGDGLEQVREVPGLFREPVRLLAVPDPLPRARVSAGVRVVDGLDALGALIDPAFDPQSTIVLPEGRPAPPPAGFTGRAAIVDERADRVRIEAELSADGFVVLADGYDPGWRARVDGKPAAMLRADVAFRAVAVPAGRHVVEMRYRPPAVIAGLLVSTATLLALLVVFARSLTVPAPPPARAEGVPPPRSFDDGRGSGR